MDQVLSNEISSTNKGLPVSPAGHFNGSSKAYTFGVLIGLADWIQAAALRKKPNRTISKSYGTPPARPEFIFARVVTAATPHVSRDDRVPRAVQALYHALVKYVHDNGSFGSQDRFSDSDKIDFLVGVSAMKRYHSLCWIAREAGKGADDIVSVPNPDELSELDEIEEAVA